ncbi:cytochrome C biogenesis protein [Rhizobium sp. Root274]|uniref:cytochrome c biogenesis CcdA family protein n=1 Tax=unclassified Rhizobium TaxID=2613769 RepID=UPI0007130D79|nr:MULTISPECIES: cytochrome c biogenesis protein CcdA [unclassified Rhizobium]KQW27399.1 cytochrome C biogenesis protein [Rhizobium sp. Root1240]KRD27634.1 cytochrome C biogenesis protein [Rhizobium sp. Root274]
MLSSGVLALLAGVLSLLNPCTLPLVPIVLASAVERHRYGPLALATGLCLSFVTIGLFVALIGFSIGLDFTIFRTFGGMLLIGLGLLLLVPAAQARFALAAGPVANWSGQRLGGFNDSGLKGQFLVGLLLGAVWSPCVGPTLGAASLLAARGENLGQVVIAMLAFGIGAALPLILIGSLSKAAIQRMRGQLLTIGQRGKALFGVLLLVTGLLVVSGLDKRVETVLVELSPVWLTDLTTRY